MPAQSQFDVARHRIYLRYYGKLTLEEFMASLAGEHDFFASMEGMVGVLIDARELQSLPFAIVAAARTRPLTRYNPLVMGMISENVFAWSMARIFSLASGIKIERFNTVEEAEDFFSQAIGIT